MSSSLIELRISMARAMDVTVTEEALTVDLEDARTISVPLAWYPRLTHGTLEERNNWCIIGMGDGIHWPDLDEHISVENLLTGSPSSESPASLKRWLGARAAQGKSIVVDTNSPLPNIKSFSIEERILIAQQIWDSFAEEDPSLPPLTDAQKSAIYRRIEAYKANPDEAIDWDAVKESIKARK